MLPLAWLLLRLDCNVKTERPAGWYRENEVQELRSYSEDIRPFSRPIIYDIARSRTKIGRTSGPARAVGAFLVSFSQVLQSPGKPHHIPSTAGSGMTGPGRAVRNAPLAIPSPSGHLLRAFGLAFPAHVTYAAAARGHPQPSTAHRFSVCPFAWHLGSLSPGPRLPVPAPVLHLASTPALSPVRPPLKSIDRNPSSYLHSSNNRSSSSIFLSLPSTRASLITLVILGITAGLLEYLSPSSKLHEYPQLALALLRATSLNRL